MTRRNLIIAVTVGVLALVAAVGVIVGVTTHKEEGLLAACQYEEDGFVLVREYLHPLPGELARCASGVVPTEIRWPRERIPLKVSIQDSEWYLEDDDPHREPLRWAIREINQQVGFELLVLQPAPTEDTEEYNTEAISVYRQVFDAKNPEARLDGHTTLGGVSHGWDEQRMDCDLFISPNIGSERGEASVAIHELLHCVGLAHHRENPGSVMYPIDPDDVLENHWDARRITDGQREILQRLYGPQNQ